MKIQVSRDTEGYLVNPEDWNNDIAIELAKEEGLELNDEYWPVLNFMRDYYSEHGIVPDIRHVANYLAKHHGFSKKEAKPLIQDSKSCRPKNARWQSQLTKLCFTSAISGDG